MTNAHQNPQLTWRDLKATATRLRFTTLGLCLIAGLTGLAAPLYMIQIYNRVLPTGSYGTLIVLSLLTLCLLTCHFLAEHVRGRLNLTHARNMDLLAKSQDLPETTRREAAKTLGRFYFDQHPQKLQDAPIGLLYVGVLWLMHPGLGILSSVGVVLSFLSSAKIAALQDSQKSQATYGRQMSIAAWQRGLKTLHHGLQAATLGLGSLLVLDAGLNIGLMIAASITLNRALVTLDGLPAALDARHAANKAQQTLNEARPALRVAA